MDIEELLARLDEHDASFPTDLVSEVIVRWDEVTPRLLGILEDIDRDPEPWLADAEGMLHIWALYLLAPFRETRAYLVQPVCTNVGLIFPHVSRTRGRQSAVMTPRASLARHLGHWSLPGLG